MLRIVTELKVAGLRLRATAQISSKGGFHNFVGPLD
jgi:hypothetical protein